MLKRTEYIHPWCPWIKDGPDPFLDYPWFGHKIVARSTNPTTNISLGTTLEFIIGQSRPRPVTIKFNQLLDPWFTANAFSDVNLGYILYVPR